MAEDVSRFSWRHDGEVIINGENYQMQSSKFDSSLTIKKCTSQDEGIYSCFAHTSRGLANTMAHLGINPTLTNKVFSFLTLLKLYYYKVFISIIMSIKLAFLLFCQYFYNTSQCFILQAPLFFANIISYSYYHFNPLTVI